MPSSFQYSPIQAVEDYLQNVPEDRKEHFLKLRETILTHLPEGFKEMFTYRMIGYVVPHELYPAGYHCNPKEPLPFINLASQKHFIGFYHMGIYAHPKLMQWFQEEYPKHCSHKLDMGKSCVRFKKIREIPYDLIAELVQKISVEEWIRFYKNSFSLRKKN